MSRPEDPDQPTADDRRKAIRYACVLEATWEDGKRVKYRPGWPVRVANISTGGIALHSGEQFPAGTVLTIGLRGPTCKRPPMKVRVVHAAEQTNTTWLLGAAYLEPLTETDLDQLLS